MFLTKRRTGTKNGTETEGRTNQEMALPWDISYLQTPNPILLPWSRGACIHEPSMAVPGYVWPVTNYVEADAGNQPLG